MLARRPAGWLAGWLAGRTSLNEYNPPLQTFERRIDCSVQIRLTSGALYNCFDLYSIGTGTLL